MHNRRFLTRSLRQAQIAIVATGGRALMSIGFWGGQRWPIDLMPSITSCTSLPRLT